jgi:hypothetical protein
VQVQELQAGQALFHFLMSGAHSRGNCACRGKIAATPAAACSRGRALLAHARLREQGVQVGARHWDGHASGGEA